MGVIKKKNGSTAHENSQPQWMPNGSITARNLRSKDLSGVIFGCTHKTIQECLDKQLFGLPASHFAYVRNIYPGMALFLFNYSNRKLYGIFEAKTSGQQRIDPYAWSSDGSEPTQYPAQVRVQYRLQCLPLTEDQFKPIIGRNYYIDKHFWFELDHKQTKALTDLCSSMPVTRGSVWQPKIKCNPPMKKTLPPLESGNNGNLQASSNFHVLASDDLSSEDESDEAAGKHQSEVVQLCEGPTSAADVSVSNILPLVEETKLDDSTSESVPSWNELGWVEDGPVFTEGVRCFQEHKSGSEVTDSRNKECVEWEKIPTPMSTGEKRMVETYCTSDQKVQEASVTKPRSEISGSSVSEMDNSKSLKPPTTSGFPTVVSERLHESSMLGKIHTQMHTVKEGAHSNLSGLSARPQHTLVQRVTETSVARPRLEISGSSVSEMDSSKGLKAPTTSEFPIVVSERLHGSTILVENHTQMHTVKEGSPSKLSVFSIRPQHTLVKRVKKNYVPRSRLEISGFSVSEMDSSKSLKASTTSGFPTVVSERLRESTILGKIHTQMQTVRQGADSKSGLLTRPQHNLVQRVKETSVMRPRLEIAGSSVSEMYISKSLKAPTTSAVPTVVSERLHKSTMMSGEIHTQMHTVKEGAHSNLSGPSTRPQHTLVSTSGKVRVEESIPSVGVSSEMHLPDQNFILLKISQELENLKAAQILQTWKVNSLELELGESKEEVRLLRQKYEKLESMSQPQPTRERSTKSICQSTSDAIAASSESIFLVGGCDGESWLSSVNLYTPSSDIITSLKPMETARSYAPATKLNGNIYVLGGVDCVTTSCYDTVASYNQSKDQWTICPPLKQPKGNLAATSVNGKIFAIGGGSGLDCFSEVEMFDGNADMWFQTRPMRNKRFAPAAVEIDGVIYVVGGYNGKNYLKSAERFDHREHSWTPLESMSTARGCHSLAVLNGKIYALGGYDGAQMVSTVEVFDPRNGKWTSGKDMNIARGYAGAVVLKESIYIMGGMKDHVEVLDTVECYKEGKGWQMTKLKGIGKRCFFSAIEM